MKPTPALTWFVSGRISRQRVRGRQTRLAGDSPPAFILTSSVARPGDNSRRAPFLKPFPGGDSATPPTPAWDNSLTILPKENLNAKLAGDNSPGSDAHLGDELMQTPLSLDGLELVKSPAIPLSRIRGQREAPASTLLHFGGAEQGGKMD